MFIGGSCDIGLFCTNIRIEAYGASNHMQLKNLDLETERASYEVNTKVVPELRKALARAHE